MPFLCAMCGMRCRSIVALKSHVQKHYGKVRGVSNTCKVCKKTFSHQRLMEVHRYHRHTHPKTELKCTECDQVFKYWRSLKRHVMYIHLNIKPHICHVCGKSFARRTFLNLHLVVHGRAVAKCLVTKEDSQSTSDHKSLVFRNLRYEKKRFKKEKKRIKKVKSVGGKIKREKIERKKIKRLKPVREKVKRKKTEGKKIKREQKERINTKKETTEVKSENEEHIEKWQIKREVFSSDKLSSYYTDIIRKSKRIRSRKSTDTRTDVPESRTVTSNCTEPRKKKFKIEGTNSSTSCPIVRKMSTRSTDVNESRADNCIEPNEKKIKIEETNSSARSQNANECTESQKTEQGNNRLKAYVRTIATRSTDVKESKPDYWIEHNNKMFKIEVSKSSATSQNVNKCTESQRIESGNKILKANVTTMATRSTDVNASRGDIETNKNRFKIEETKRSARSQDINEGTEDRLIEPDNIKPKANVRTKSTRSTYVKECKEEKNSQSDPIMLTTNARRISKRISDANDYKDDDTSESGEKRVESVTREGSTNIDAKVKKEKQCSKLDENTFENATDSEVHSDTKDYEVNQSKELDEKSLQNVEREDSSGNSNVKEYKNINSKLEEKHIAIQTVCTGSTDVSSNECTDRNEKTLGESKPNMVNLNVFDRKSTIEGTDFKECKEDQSVEMDIGKLRMILMKNSETGEWTTSESLKKTVSLESKESASDNEEKKMCVSKDQPDVDKNVKCENRNQKRTEIKVDNDNNEKFKGKKYDMNDELCLLNAGKTRARNVERTEQKLIAKGSIGQNSVHVSNNPNPSTELTEYSSRDVVIVEFFEDRNLLFSNEIENTYDADSKDIDLTRENVDIKLIPYQNWGTDRKANVKKEHILNDVLTKDSTITSDREEVNFFTADVVVIDCEDDSSMEDCDSDIENDVGNQARFIKAKNEHIGTKKKPENISSPLVQSMNTHAENIENPNNMFWQHVDNKIPHMDQNHSKGEISVNESFKADDVNIQHEMSMPNDKDAAHTNSHINWNDITGDTVGKNNDRHVDLPTKHKIESQSEVKEWTICKSKVLGLNDKIHRKRNDVFDIADSVTHRDLVEMSVNRIAGVLDYTQRNLNHEQKINETFVNYPKGIETQSIVEPDFRHTGMNDTSTEVVSEGVSTNLNDLCWNQTFPANSVDNITDSFKDVEELIGWTVDQILSYQNMSVEETSKLSSEHQYEDLVQAFNVKKVEHSDKHNDCVEVYVINGDGVDENNNTTEQVVISDNFSTESQVPNVDFGPGSCSFDTGPNTGCYQTVNIHDFRSFRYDSQVHAVASDSLNCGHVCNEGNDSEISDCAEQDLNLQVHGHLLETDISPNLSTAIDINTDYIPYWDTCQVAEMGTKSLNSDERKFQGMKNVRGSERSTYTSSDLQQGRESGYNSQESPSAVYEESYGLNDLDSDKRNRNVNFVCGAVDNKNVNVHETGVSSCIEGMTVTKSKIDTGTIHEVKLAATGKKELTKSRHSNMQEGKGGGKRRKCGLCTLVEDDIIARNKLLKKLKSGQIGDRPRVVRVTEHGMILDVTEEYQDYLPYLYGC